MATNTLVGRRSDRKPVVTLVHAAGRRASSKRRANLAHGRCIEDFEPLTHAERRLIRKCAEGLACELETRRPTKQTRENTIRAEVIRFLVLGGDKAHPVHEIGVWIVGAWIVGKLDLECVSSSVFLALEACELDGLLRATDATLPGLRLEGTRVRALDADRLTVHGSVFLTHEFSSHQEVRFVGSHIGGNLDCDSGKFHARPFRSAEEVGDLTEVRERPVALRLEGAVIDGDALLGDRFTAMGEVRLSGAQIGQNLTCSGGSFNLRPPDDSGTKKKRRRNKRPPDAGGSDDEQEASALRADGIRVAGGVFLNNGFVATGPVSLTGAQIKGSLHCAGGKFKVADEIHNKGLSLEDRPISIDGQRMIIDGKLQIKQAQISAHLNLTDARASTVEDSRDCWPDKMLILDGFRYERFSDGSTNASDRIEWLRKQTPKHLGNDFRPQPWEQLISALRAMGHPKHATDVAIEKQHLWGRSGALNGLAWLTHHLYGMFAVYGYRPTRTIVWVLAVMIGCAILYDEGARSGAFGPVAPAIQISPALDACGGHTEPWKVYWTSPLCPLPSEYSRFQPLLYSADLILPFVDLQQEKDWAPTVPTGGDHGQIGGQTLRIVMWFEIIFGWIMSLLLLAALGRVLNRD